MTDHKVEIDRILMVAHKPNNYNTKFGHRLECAAALLGAHDVEGIDLDNWFGPREFVDDTLAEFGMHPFRRHYE